jgi:hypothetical protein
MANVNLNDVELKIDLIASLENSVQTGADKNHWSVDWDLNYLHKYNKNRIFLVLENGVFVPNVDNNGANNVSIQLIGEGIQFRHRIVGSLEPQTLCYIKQANITGSSTLINYNSTNNIGNGKYIYELERIPDKTVTFKLLDSRRLNGARVPAISNNDAAIFDYIDLQFSILIMKSKK